MLNTKEISLIVAVTLILAFVITLMSSLNEFLIATLAIFIVITINVLAKKIIGFYLDAETEIRIWKFNQNKKRPWSLSNLLNMKHHKISEKPIPLGALMPLIVIVITQGALAWMACLVFDVKSAVYRSAKRHNIYKFSEMSEWHIGLIAASGIIANLFLALVGYLIEVPIFTKINLMYAFYNIIPISELDGNKIFFSNVVLWMILGVISTIGLLYALLIPFP